MYPLSISDAIQLLNVAMVSVGVAFAMVFALRWQKNRDRERNIELEILKEKEYRAAKVTSTPPVGVDTGGYIILNLPDDQKTLFHDVLKGFEEFAKLKGYEISFSVDNSIPDKIAFKFTIGQAGISVSTQRVENDLHEYIEKVQRGDSLDDIPIVLPETQHHALIMAMRNRINFLHHTYVAQKNVLEFYEQIMRSQKSGSMGVVPANNFYLQNGGTLMPTQYTAIGSQNVVQGKGNEVSGNSVDMSIKIAGSFNERKSQIEAIEKLIVALRDNTPPGNEVASRAITNLEKVSDELKHEEKPDESRVRKWLEATKNAIGTLGLTNEVLDIAKDVFSNLGFGA